MESRTDEHLANGTTGRKTQYILPHSGVPSHKVQRGGHLARTTRYVHADPVAQASCDKIRADKEIRARDEGAHHVVGAHHLRTTIGSESLKDVVLGAVRQAVKEEVDAQEQESPRGVGILRNERLLLLAGVESEYCHAGGHGRHHEVFIQRVPFLEDGDV